MKKFYYILSFLLILVFSENLKSQQELIATIQFKNVILLKPNILEFELRITRDSESWLYWVNGTFEFNYDSTTYTVNPTLDSIEYVEQSSELNILPLTGLLPTESYIISPRVFNGRFSITVLGPKEYQFCNRVGLDTNGLKIGRFRMIRKSGDDIPTKLKWLEPSYYYQACAFKMTNDSLIVPSVYVNYTHDNIEMDDNVKHIVSYKSYKAPMPVTIVNNFNADYKGQKNVLLSWESKSEAYVKGWVIARAMRDFLKSENIENLVYKDTIADFRRNYPPHSDLTGLGTRKPGRYYAFVNDTVPYRGIDYCYKLMYYDDFGRLIDKMFIGDTLPAPYMNAISCLPIPNAVIVAAENRPNPFPNTTKVNFTVDDDVYLTAKVFDVQGKLVETFFENKFIPKGKHFYDNYSFDFNASPFAQQELYDIVLIATPINDKSVDISKAIIKAQLIR